MLIADLDRSLLLIQERSFAKETLPAIFGEHIQIHLIKNVSQILTHPVQLQVYQATVIQESMLARVILKLIAAITITPTLRIRLI
jgi:hypothetical protein